MITAIIICLHPLFQSTLPRRKRLWYSGKCFPLKKFQSTLPRRKRPVYDYDKLIARFISIHASAKEATLPLLTIHVHLPISIHASAKEATFNSLESKNIDIISIHASAKEATNSTCPLKAIPKFQSTLPRRKRPHPAAHPLRTHQFQSTLPRRKRRISDISLPIFSFISIHASAKEATLHAC